MAKTIGFDPVPDSVQTKLWQFVLLAWKDAILRIFDFNGRTSRRAFLLSVTPIFVIWIGLIGLSFILPRSYQILDNGFYLLFLFIPLAMISTLIVRRLHDSGKKAISMFNPLHLINPFSSLISILKLLQPSDEGENEFGPPHILGNVETEHAPNYDPKNIG